MSSCSCDSTPNPGFTQKLYGFANYVSGLATVYVKPTIGIFSGLGGILSAAVSGHHLTDTFTPGQTLQSRVEKLKSSIYSANGAAVLTGIAEYMGTVSKGACDIPMLVFWGALGATATGVWNSFNSKLVGRIQSCAGVTAMIASRLMDEKTVTLGARLYTVGSLTCLLSAKGINNLIKKDYVHASWQLTAAAITAHSVYLEMQRYLKTA